MVTLKRKVLLLGKTGTGKSTVANMLVSGELLAQPVFKTGDGMHFVTDTCAAYTGRGYHVVDTIGLGEETESHRKNATDLIYKFLKETQGEYSHILFVTPAGRFDTLDRDIFKHLCEIFRGAEPAFAVVVTKCNNPEKRKQENEKSLQEKFGKFVRPDRFMYVNFPPLVDIVDEDCDKAEALVMRKRRQKSLESLEASLDRLFEENDSQDHQPHFSGYTDEGLLQYAKRIFLQFLKYARQFLAPELQN